MHTSDEYSLYLQDMVENNNNIVDENEVVLQESDIYKDLRVCGYDYGMFFRSIKSLRTKNFRQFDGMIKWEGNWVTFMDGLFQSVPLTLPQRQLIVPVMIKRLVCDLKIQFEGMSKYLIEEEPTPKVTEGNAQLITDLDDLEESTELNLHNFQFDRVLNNRLMCEAVLPFHVDTDLGLVVTHGIEMECVEGLPIPRKSDIQDMKIESYQFISNEDMNAIQCNYYESVAQYIEV